MAKAVARPTAYRRVVTEGGGTVARQGLGEMPLTLWVLVAAVILYLYLRRANLGIDTHPGEAVTVRPQRSPPVLPPVPGGFLPPDTRGLTIIPVPSGPAGGGLLQ